MRTLIVLMVLVCSGTTVYARSVTNNDFDISSRTLKGVLKHQKDGPRITDSESLEFEEVNQETSVIPEQVLRQKVSAAEPKPVLKTEERQRESMANDETTVSPQSLSKSDLYLDDLLEDDVDDCIEGDVMKVSCNTCVCSDAKYFCSKRDCQTKQPLPPPDRPSTKRKGIITYHSVKGEASSVKKQNHHEQKISHSDEIKNTTATSFNSIVDNSQCIDGRTKPVDCNQCICAQGQWACTKMLCIALTLREKASYTGDQFLKSVGTLKEHSNIDEDCMEGDAKPNNCNQCVCHMNSWACSDFTCPSTPPPPKPEAIEEACQTEEDVKSKDCNICSCRRGIWVCTKNDCKKFGNRYFNPIFQKHHSNENDQEDG